LVVGGCAFALIYNIVSTKAGLHTLTDEEKHPDPAGVIEKIKAGETSVIFGEYLWRVLEVEEDRALLITEDIVARRDYNDQYVIEKKSDEDGNYEMKVAVDTTWEESSLREYLNGEFLSQRFDQRTEQPLILPTEVVNTKNEESGTRGGNNTVDKIFLLSIDEAKKYLPTKKDQQAYYAGIDSGNSGAIDWWLRSPGAGKNGAAVVRNAEIYESGYGALGINGVRPALYLNLNAR
jgi:hypothetical protein